MPAARRAGERRSQAALGQAILADRRQQAVLIVAGVGAVQDVLREALCLGLCPFCQCLARSAVGLGQIQFDSGDLQGRRLQAVRAAREDRHGRLADALKAPEYVQPRLLLHLARLQRLLASGLIDPLAPGVQPGGLLAKLRRFRL